MAMNKFIEILHLFLAIVPDRTRYMFSSELSPLANKDNFLKTLKKFPPLKQFFLK